VSALQVYKKFMNIKKGFTLIEILIVLMIIGIMVTIATFGIQGAREAARDAKRKTDLENVKTALELYFNDCGAYPAPSSGNLPDPIIGDGSVSNCPVTNIYMSDVPTDPLPTLREYSYTTPIPTSYVLCSALEEDPIPAMDVSACGSCSEACNYIVSGP